MAKLGKSRVQKSALKVKAKAKVAEVKAKGRELTRQAVAKKIAKPAAEVAPVASAKNQPKKVSQKLIETIEKRKQAAHAGVPRGGGANKSSIFGKPPARRGRRPKNSNVEYTPQNAEEEYTAVEHDHESIEYDTGIRVKSSAEDKGFGVERFEEFDEELNFDW